MYADPGDRYVPRTHTEPRSGFAKPKDGVIYWVTREAITAQTREYKIWTRTFDEETGEWSDPEVQMSPLLLRPIGRYPITRVPINTPTWAWVDGTTRLYQGIASAWVRGDEWMSIWHSGNFVGSATCELFAIWLFLRYGQSVDVLWVDCENAVNYVNGTLPIISDEGLKLRPLIQA